MDIPDAVMALGERIARAGGELFVVGGWVRDRLMGVDCTDIDLAVNLPPEQVKLSAEGLGSIYDLGERFGTVGIKVEGYTLEVTTYRSEEYLPGSRHPRVTPVKTIEEDLARRDFTINALAVSVAPDPGILLDPFGGLADIEARLIRTPGSPSMRMAEDPLRMMRAVRFASQLDFEIDPGLLEVLRAEPAVLDEISWERRRDELEKILVSGRPGSGLRTLVQTRLMDYVAPEVAATEGVEQPSAYHRADVLEHTLLTMEYLPADALLRRAGLFHDVGKPPARVTEPKLAFHEHDRIGADLTRNAMRRLRYSNDETRKTAFVVRKHMRPIHYESTWSTAAVRRLIRDCTLVKDDEVLVPLDAVIELARADIRAGNLEKAPHFLALVDDLERRVEEVRAREAVERLRSPLDGRELMELFGRPQGPWLKELKAFLTDKVIAGELAGDDKEGAARMAAEFLESADEPLSGGPEAEQPES